MDAKQLAEDLQGVSYPPRFPRSLIDLAIKHRLVIAYGASDDLLEFDGAISDEVGCYDGCTALVDGIGLIPDRTEIGVEDADLHHWLHRKERAKEIKALWCAEPNISWTIRTIIPHETFDITEEGSVFSVGIVFSLDNLGGE